MSFTADTDFIEITGPELNSLRKIAEAGWGVSSFGDVESPQGYVWLVEVPDENDGTSERYDMFAACEIGHGWDDGVYQYPEPWGGWYVV